MIIIIIIFFISIILAFGMLTFRAWEIRTSRLLINTESMQTYKKGLSFEEIEKIVLFSFKHIIQWIVIFIVKNWFIIITKIKRLIQNKLPKIHKLFKKKPKTESRKISFVERAVMESKIKIRKVKEKIKKDHEEKA